MSDGEKKHSEDLSSLSIDELREKVKANTTRIERNQNDIENFKLNEKLKARFEELKARISEQSKRIHDLKFELSKFDEEFQEIFEREEYRSW